MLPDGQPTPREGAADPTADAEDALNLIDGIVIDASYVGVSTQSVVRTPDHHELIVCRQNLETSGAAEVLASGQRDRLSWRPQRTFVIPAPMESAETGGRADA